MTLDKVKQILVDYNGCDASEITKETTFEALGLDSLDTVELIMSFEEEFGITIDMSEGMKTIGDIVDIIDNAKK